MNSDCKCSLCGSPYHNFEFKGGYVCEDCVKYIKSSNELNEAYDSGKPVNEKPNEE